METFFEVDVFSKYDILIKNEAENQEEPTAVFDWSPLFYECFRRFLFPSHFSQLPIILFKNRLLS